VEEFVNRYFEKYGEEPSILEAQGFDAANILLTLLDRPEVRSREALRLSLAQLKNYPGVTGGTTFNLQGDADKVLFLLQIQNGNVVQIN
jgi:ABC-type branched-subunit amino acid transport system substrate-binding protein